jgi:hypothetical protein
MCVMPARRIAEQEPAEVVDQRGQPEDTRTALTRRLARQPLHDPMDLTKRAGVRT